MQGETVISNKLIQTQINIVSLICRYEILYQHRKPCLLYNMKGETQLCILEKQVMLTREGNRETGKGREYSEEHCQRTFIL